MASILSLLAETPSGFLGQIQGFVTGIVEKAYNFLSSLEWWIQAIIIVIAALFIVMGVIYFIVKSWKFLMVLVVLGGIGFLVYYFFIKKDSNPAPVETITQFGKVVAACL